MTAFIAVILSLFLAFFLVQIPGAAILLIGCAFGKMLDNMRVTARLWVDAILISTMLAFGAVLALYVKIYLWCYGFILPLLGG